MVTTIKKSVPPEPRGTKGEAEIQDGCTYWDHCLTCPIPVCRHDNAARAKGWVEANQVTLRQLKQRGAR